MSSTDRSEVRAPIPETEFHFVKFVGGAAAVTKVTGTGPGVAVTYISTGVVDLTWSAASAPGTFLGPAGMPCFQATTITAVKGYTCEVGVYDATTRTLRLNISNAAQALADLAALQWLNVTVAFKRAAV